MANFYLCRVWTFTQDGTSEVIRLTEADTSAWTMHRHDSSTMSVRLPYPKYTFQISRVPNVQWNENPEFCLVRCEGTLDAGDFNVDMQTKGAAYWQTMYDTYPYLAAHPYADAPYQPT